jgi:elongation factor P
MGDDQGSPRGEHAGRVTLLATVARRSEAAQGSTSPVIGTSDFKRGIRILVDGQPYFIEDFTVHTPSARGAATLVRSKLRHVVDGTYVDRTFKAGEKFEEPDVAFRRVQVLYRDAESCHFMDLESYEQFALTADLLGDTVPWLHEGLELGAIVYNGRVVGVNLPQLVETEVEMVGGGARGDTASGKNLKEARLTNGVVIKVPLFIETGERILVDPRTGEYARRSQR